MVRRICDDARIVQINEYSFDTGDTLIIDDLKDIPRRYPEIDLALLHLGGTRVLGIMVTMDAKQGVQMIRLIQPWRAIPIHYNDYDVFRSPLSDFQQEVQGAGLEEWVQYLAHGRRTHFLGDGLLNLLIEKENVPRSEAEEYKGYPNFTI